MTWDLLLRNGTVVDGTGAPRRVADVGIRDGRIVAVESDLAGEAAETIDAEGRLVTPGFVDVHTHYDGQVSWDTLLEPSSAHGVTTVVTGNCGVGFAPVRPGQEEWLIQLMEGVEDIPGAALAEGIAWGWEHIGEYLDHLEGRRYAVDVATQVAHGAVRGYVMGERGARNQPANADDIAAMARIVQEGIELGALGVSTSRTLGHRALDGEPVPGTFAAEDELFGLGRALAAGGGGVFELAPAGAAGLDVESPPKEIDWMRRLSGEIGQPVTFAMLQVSAAPDQWKFLMAESLAAAADGAALYPQVAARPFGMLVGLGTNHPFGKRPSFLALAHLPVAEQAAAMREPGMKARILAEADEAPDPGALMDGLPLLFQAMLHQLYVMGDPPDYEPTADRTVAALAEAAGVDPLDLAYDLLAADDGANLLMLPFFNYVEGDHEVIREQLLHPNAVWGLGDGGAHCRMICDASIPTYTLTHWARDRHRGPRIDLEYVIRKQTLDTATLYGLGDRGVLAPGKRADLNVIDHAALTLCRPHVAADLPAGGKRLLQGAEGYVATIVGGQVTRRNGVDTGARPGRLVRGRR